MGGSAAKKYGGKTILVVSVLLWSMSTFMVPFFAHSIYALILSRVILGLGEGLGKSTVIIVIPVISPFSLFCFLLSIIMIIIHRKQLFF